MAVKRNQLEYNLKKYDVSQYYPLISDRNYFHQEDVDKQTSTIKSSKSEYKAIWSQFRNKWLDAE